MERVAVRRWKQPPLIPSPPVRWCLWISAGIYFAVVLGTMEVNWGRVIEGLPCGAKFISGFFPPDFIANLDEILSCLYESIWMTVTSLVVGVALSIPIGLAAAKNLASAPIY